VFLKFSRDDERDADRVGLQIMTRAGWDGRGMIQLLQLIRQESTRDPAAGGVFLSTHPSPQERIALRQRSSSRSIGRLDSTQFQRLHKRLATLPPARAFPVDR